MHTYPTSFNRGRLCAMIVTIIAALIIARPLKAGSFYVAPDGDDQHPGTLKQPFASLARAQDAAKPGDTVWIRGGRYELKGGKEAGPYAVLFNKSGKKGHPIRYWAYKEEKPVFDFYGYRPHERVRGFSVQADYLHFKGLELEGVQQIILDTRESWGIRVEGPRGGHNNVFEQIDLHHHEGPGLFIQSGGNNLVLNCDSHHNYDPDRGGQNADGFGSHSKHDGNVFKGCRAWENSDDGFDFINSPGTVTLIGSWSWRNGYVPGTQKSAGNGAGIKAGGFGLDPNRFPRPDDVPCHEIRGNLSFHNRVQGFYANHHPGRIDWIGNVAFGNPHGFNLLNDVAVDKWPAKHHLRQNIAFKNKRDIINANRSLIDSAENSWDEGFGVSAEDFASLSPDGVDGRREKDGGLPKIAFMNLIGR